MDLMDGLGPRYASGMAHEQPQWPWDPRAENNYELMAYYSNRIQSLGLDKIKIIGSDTMKQLKENKEFVKFMEFEEP